MNSLAQHRCVQLKRLDAETTSLHDLQPLTPWMFEDFVGTFSKSCMFIMKTSTLAPETLKL